MHKIIKLSEKYDRFVIANKDTLLTISLFLYIFARGIEMAEIAEWAIPYFGIFARLVQITALVIAGSLFFNSILHHCAVTNILLLFVGVILLICCSFSQSYELIWGYLFIVSAENTSIRGLPKIVFYCAVLILFSVIALHITGVAETVVIGRSDSAELRNSLGFYHPNRLVEVYLLAVLSYLMYKYNNIKLIDCGVIAVSCLIIYGVTGTRTVLFAVAMTITVFILAQQMSTHNRNLPTTVLPMLFLLIALASVFATLLYDENSSFLNFINNILSGRLIYPSALYSAVGIPLFGMNMEGTSELISNVPYFSSDVVPIDNYYNHVVFYNGPFVLLIELIVLYSISKYTSYSKYSVYYLGLMICIILGVSESYVGDVAFNFSILLAAPAMVEFDSRVRKYVQVNDEKLN